MEVEKALDSLSGAPGTGHWAKLCNNNDNNNNNNNLRSTICQVLF